jgi:hypothetical protein
LLRLVKSTFHKSILSLKPTHLIGYPLICNGTVFGGQAIGNGKLNVGGEEF